MFGRLIHRAALALALVGGLVLIALALLTLANIVGRALTGLGLGPVPGSYELVELGIGFAVFCFLPWCQLQRGQVAVDLFLAPLGRRAIGLAAVAADLLMTLAAGVILWRLWLGLLDKQASGETSFILGLPLWIGYAGASLGALVFLLASARTAAESLTSLRGGGTP